MLLLCGRSRVIRRRCMIYTTFTVSMDGGGGGDSIARDRISSNRFIRGFVGNTAPTEKTAAGVVPHRRNIFYTRTVYGVSQCLEDISPLKLSDFPYSQLLSLYSAIHTNKL